MDAISQDGDKKKYTTPRWVQVWFLQRSRDNWKKKYKELKFEAKRMRNRVKDVTDSREPVAAVACSTSVPLRLSETASSRTIGPAKAVACIT